MKIIKRDGSKQAFAPNKILNRIKRVAKGLNVSSDKIFQKVIPLIKDGMTATDIDEIIAFQAADLQIEHPDYAVLGGRILISRQAKLLEVEEKPVDEQFDSFAASTFLKKYSLKNEKGIPVEIPSMMYNRVANHLYTDSFKERRNLLNELYEKKINFATPILSNSGIEGRNGLISCFDKDTKIVTDSGLKKISEIKVGDNVLTHKNRFMPVNEVYKNEMVNRGVKLVKIYRTEAIKCTDNHEFLSYTSEDERLGLSPSFKPIKCLRVGDYIKGAFLNDNNKSQNIIIDLLDYKDYITDNWEKFKATKDTKIKSIDIKLIEGDKIQIISVFEKKDGRLVTKEGSIINRYWNIDEDFCKFLGIFYGDGHIQRSSKNGPQGIGFTTKEISPNVVNFITEYGTKILGIEPKIYTQKFGDRSWNKIMFASKMVCVIWEHLFGLGYGGKHVPYFINSLSKKEVDNLIAGLISSDGNVTKKGQIRVSMANENIITNINSIGRRNGYTTGVSVARNRQGTPMYRIDFGNDTELLKLISKDYSDDRMSIIKTQLNKTHIKIINGEYYYRINDINDVIDYNEKYVYDLNVEEDHSYSVENVVVHNCNLTMLKSDSIEGINETLDKISQGSKEGSGIGLNIDPIRSSRSLVSSFKGYAGGVVRFADMVQSHMRFYKQGNRSGSCALYLSTWHRDILEFLELRLPIGEELNRARDLFTAVSIDDVFMEALINETDYYLFCPNDIKKAGLKALHEVHGEEFREIYNKAVELGIGYKTEPKKIWDAIIRSQVESGTPYVFYKDNANKRNMQDNIGVISQSNLCCEILQASKPGYTPQCTLASVNLAEHDNIKTITKSTKVLVRALNQVINKNKWSDEWSKNAGEDQRAIAIGVAGLADFFAKKKISFESEEAKEWTEKIFEAMYKAAVTESMNLAIEEGSNYPAWEGSRYSKGETYIEGWSPAPKGEPIPMKNSLLLGLMPTASSAILLGAFECFEPITSNVFTRMVGDGEFIVVNKYLVNELNELGLWNENIRNKIIANEGSVQDIQEIPEDIRYRYKTIWEIPQKALLDLSIIRNKYVDQSQSLNVYHADAKYSKISSALVYAWKNGLKTGAYYTRTKSKLGSNKKLSASDNVDNKQVLPKRPENSMFTCAGGGCDS